MPSSAELKTNLRRIIPVYVCEKIKFCCVYLVNIVHSCESVEPEVHGVKHVDNLDGFTHGADIREGHHITEQYGALFKFTCRMHEHMYRHTVVTLDTVINRNTLITECF